MRYTREDDPYLPLLRQFQATTAELFTVLAPIIEAARDATPPRFQMVYMQSAALGGSGVCDPDPDPLTPCEPLAPDPEPPDGPWTLTQLPP
jgi:hypothetical protein